MRRRNGKRLTKSRFHRKGPHPQQVPNQLYRRCCRRALVKLFLKSEHSGRWPCRIRRSPRALKQGLTGKSSTAILARQPTQQMLQDIQPQQLFFYGQHLRAPMAMEEPYTVRSREIQNWTLHQSGTYLLRTSSGNLTILLGYP